MAGTAVEGLSGNQGFLATLLREGLSLKRNKHKEPFLAMQGHHNKPKGEGLHGNPLHPRSPGTPRDHTERFFARGFLTTNVGIKVFR